MSATAGRYVSTRMDIANLLQLGKSYSFSQSAVLAGKWLRRCAQAIIPRRLTMLRASSGPKSAFGSTFIQDSYGI